MLRFFTVTFVLTIVVFVIALVVCKSGCEHVCDQIRRDSHERGVTRWCHEDSDEHEFGVVLSTPAFVRSTTRPITEKCRVDLHRVTEADVVSETKTRRLASEKNQVMDELLARPDIPSDYGAEMVALYRDRAQDVYTRDFAVQHIGLYAEALNRRGTYDPASREAGELRKTLWAASGETSTIVAAAAFRALADLAGFDPKINARRLDSRLVSCAGDASASSAARVMAVQLCGERGIAASRPLLRRVLSDAATSVPLKKAAEWSLQALDGKVVAQ